MAFSGNSWNVLTSMCRRKNKGHIRGRAVLIATDTNLLDTKYEFYGLNDDLTDTIN